jgi:hypothetical protein
VSSLSGNTLEMSAENLFLFSAGNEESIHGEKKPYNSREMHLRRVNDILHLSILKDDFNRARKAWTILARSVIPDYSKSYLDWKQIWDIGLSLIEENDHQSKIEYSQTMMFKRPEEVRSMS